MADRRSLFDYLVEARAAAPRQAPAVLARIAEREQAERAAVVAAGEVVDLQAERARRRPETTHTGMGSTEG